MEKGADPLLSGYDEEYPGELLCALDHIDHTPLLRQVFSKHDQFRPPPAPPSTKSSSMSLSQFGVVKLTVPAHDEWKPRLKAPLKSWILSLTANSPDVSPYSMELPVRHVPYSNEMKCSASQWSYRAISLCSTTKYEFKINERKVVEALFGAVKAGELFFTLQVRTSCGVSEQTSESKLVDKGYEKIIPAVPSGGSTPRSTRSISDAIPQSPKVAISANMIGQFDTDFKMQDIVTSSEAIEEAAMAADEKQGQPRDGERRSMRMSFEEIELPSEFK